MLCMFVSNSTRWVIDHDHCMQNVHYVSHSHVNTKFSLSTSFPIAYPSVSKIIGS